MAVLLILAALFGASEALCRGEHLVKTRDGITLTTYVTTPEPCNAKYPAVIDRTPYGPTVDEFAQLWLPFGFATVLQNQRGCFTSGGVYNFWKQDGYDAYDTMAWITNQTWSNGQIYASGVSADGISEYADYIIPNPYLMGGYAMWASAFGHETAFWGGAYRQDLISHWLLSLNTCPNAPNIESQVRANEAYDEWWAPLEANGPYGNHFPNVIAPGVTQAGWWDIFQQGQLDTYQGTITYGDPSIRDKQWMFIIPLGHCTGDESSFDYPKFEILAPQELATAIFQGNYSNPIFKIIDKYNFYVFGLVPAYVPRGTNYTGNYYTSLPNWPAYTSTNWYLNGNGVLSTSAPTAAGSLTYTYDPNDPSPSYGGNNLYSSSHCGPLDQTKIENRTDIIKFTSAVLSQPLAIVGRIWATLNVKSSAVDTDFMVALTDVYPDGKSVLTRYGAVRMKWIQNASEPHLITPGQIYQINVDFWSTAYIFQAGHALRLTVTSSNAPQFNPNPNNGYALNDTTGPIIVAQNTVLWGPTALSYITLPVVDIKDIPENTYLH